MADVHRKETTESIGPAPVTCEACGKTLGDEAFTVTVSLTDARTGLPRTIEVPVCDEACGKRYMLDIRSALMLSMKVDRVS